jgi:hypothetical protein
MGSVPYGPFNEKFYDPREDKIDGIFTFRESKKNLKKTLGLFFFVNLVPRAQKSIYKYKGELF